MGWEPGTLSRFLRALDVALMWLWVALPGLYAFCLLASAFLQDK
jgi:hypothetical protein